LVICGINWGLPPGESPTNDDAEFEPWADFFADEGNRDRFRNRITEWLRIWGQETSSSAPTEFDWAIAQTNVFYTSSSGFDPTAYSDDDWIAAFRRLSHGMRELNASGLLLTSIKAGDKLGELMPRLGDARQITWQEEKKGSFRLRFGQWGSIPVANCPHPRNPQYFDQVALRCEGMGEWLAGIMARYRVVQSRL